MVVHADRGVFVTDVNTLPGFGKSSVMHTAMESVGMNLSEITGD